MAFGSNVNIGIIKKIALGNPNKLILDTRKLSDLNTLFPAGRGSKVGRIVLRHFPVFVNRKLEVGNEDQSSGNILDESQTTKAEQIEQENVRSLEVEDKPQMGDGKIGLEEILTFVGVVGVGLWLVNQA